MTYQQLTFDFSTFNFTEKTLSFDDLVHKHRKSGLQSLRRLPDVRKNIEAFSKTIGKINTQKDLSNHIIDQELSFLLPWRKEPYCLHQATMMLRKPNHFGVVYPYELKTDYKTYVRLGYIVLDAICIHYTKKTLRFSILGSNSMEPGADYQYEQRDYSEMRRFELNTVFKFRKNQIIIDDSSTRALLHFIQRVQPLPESIDLSERHDHPQYYNMYVFEKMMRFSLNRHFSNERPLYIEAFSVQLSKVLDFIRADIEKRYFGGDFNGTLKKYELESYKEKFVRSTALRDLTGSFDAFMLYCNTIATFQPPNIPDTINVLSSFAPLNTIHSSWANIIDYISETCNPKEALDITYNKWIIGQTITVCRQLHEDILKDPPTTPLALSQLNRVVSMIVSFARVYYVYYNNKLKDFATFIHTPLFGEKHPDMTWYKYFKCLITQKSSGLNHQSSQIYIALANVLYDISKTNTISNIKLLRILESWKGDNQYHYNEYYVRDIGMMFNRLKKDYPEDFAEIKWDNIRTMTELHDTLSKTMTKAQHKPVLRKNVTYDRVIGFIEQNPVVSIKGVGQYKLCLPESSLDMVVWGSEQRHCIGSYTSHLNDINSVFLGIWDIMNHQWVGHMQVVKNSNKWSVRQFYGKQNSMVPPPMNEFFKELVLKVLNVKDGQIYQLEKGEEVKELVSV